MRMKSVLNLVPTAPDTGCSEKRSPQATLRIEMAAELATASAVDRQNSTVSFLAKV